MIDLEKLKKLLEEDMDNPNSYPRRWARQEALNNKRAEKLNTYLISLSDKEREKFIDKLISKHNEEYCSRCYNQGYEPPPLNFMYLLFRTAENFGEIFRPKEGNNLFVDFPTSTFYYLDYYYQIIYGQGSVVRICNSNKEVIFSL